jgi:hypothetical protein
LRTHLRRKAPRELLSCRFSNFRATLSQKDGTPLLRTYIGRRGRPTGGDEVRIRSFATMISLVVAFLTFVPAQLARIKGSIQQARTRGATPAVHQRTITRLAGYGAGRPGE